MRTPPPWAMVTVLLPTTTPVKVTVPAAAGRTAVPSGTPMSIPQCPAYGPTGANSLITGPATGRFNPPHPGAASNPAIIGTTSERMHPPCASPPPLHRTVCV